MSIGISMRLSRGNLCSGDGLWASLVSVMTFRIMSGARDAADAEATLSWMRLFTLMAKAMSHDARMTNCGSAQLSSRSEHTTAWMMAGLIPLNVSLYKVY